MDNKGLSLTLSSISFRLDESSEARIINDVTASVVKQLSASLEADFAKLIEEMKSQFSAAAVTQAAAETVTIPAATLSPETVAAEQPRRRGGRRRKESEAAEAEEPQTPEAPVAEAQTETTVAPKRRGGRVRKEAQVAETVAKPESTASEEAAVVESTRPGRRRKSAETQPEAETQTEAPRRGGRKRKVEVQPARGRRARVHAPGVKIEDIPMSTTMKLYLIKNGANTISEALSFANDSKLKELMKDKSINKHSMVYQVVKFLRESGYSSVIMRRFQNAVEAAAETAGGQKKKALKEEAKSASTQGQKQIITLPEQQEPQPQNPESLQETSLS